MNARCLDYLIEHIRFRKERIFNSIGVRAAQRVRDYFCFFIEASKLALCLLSIPRRFSFSVAPALLCS